MKLDSSCDTDSSSESTHSFSEENSDDVTFYCLQLVEKKIIKSKVDVMFKDAVEIIKDDYSYFRNRAASKIYKKGHFFTTKKLKRATLI